MKGFLRRAATLACAATLLCAAPRVNAQVVRQVTDLKRSLFSVSRTGIDDAGTMLFFSSSGESFGANPGHAFRVVAWDHPTGEGSFVSTLQPEFPPSVSDDGAWLAFTSAADPTGENADGSAELFVASSNGQSVVQLTDVASPEEGSILEVTLAGSGNRMAFVSDADLAGLNPGGGQAIFIIDIDGTNLRRLGATLVGDVWNPVLSDDGIRVVFRHNGDPLGTNPDGSYEIFAILANDSDLRQLTSGVEHALAPTISGDGTRVAFNGTDDVFVLDWDGSGLTNVGPGSGPTLTDDGSTVYYAGGTGWDQVQRKDLVPDDVPPVPLTFDPFMHHCCAVVSGDGNRLAYRSSPNRDAWQLNVMNVDATDPRRLGDHGPQGLAAYEPDITADGTRIVFGSNEDILAANPGYADQIFRVQTDGSDLAPVTALTAGVAWHPRVTADGDNVIFMSYSDLAGVDPNSDQRTFRIGSDGSGLIQISPIGELGEHADVSDDGSTVVQQGWTGIVRTDLDGGNPLTLAGVSGRAHPRINANGEWVVYHSVGGPPSVFRAATDGSLVEPLAADAGYNPTISADGTRIAFWSSGDPFGTNTDSNAEIFVYEPHTATLRQLTTSSGGDCLEPAISGSGEWVYFKSRAPLTDAVPLEGLNFDLYRVAAVGGTIERVGGLGGGGWHGWGSSRNTTQLELDFSGRRAVITLTADWTGDNPDLTQELFLIDFTVAPRLRLDKVDATVLTWDVAAGPRDYDVVRGDVADLGPSPGGGVDLGPVVCLENDLVNTTTIHLEDPQPGQAFFYVFRGSQGSLSGPGSWGAGTTGERIPDDGSCAD